MDLADGRALVVDASRDLRAMQAEADCRGLRIAYAADTHLHADFLSGAVQLAADEGATVLASKAGDREFPHRGLSDGDEVDLGGLRLQTMATPGHTHEHIAFELLDHRRTLGVFTGGSLIVGSTARTDLVSPERTEELPVPSTARCAGWPSSTTTSRCGRPTAPAVLLGSPGSERTSTIGTERATNTLLRAESEDAFVQQLLDSLGSFPPYFLTLGEINRRGPELLRGDSLPGLAPGEVARLRQVGVEVVDVRPVADFAAAHVPGSVSIPLRPVFATWLGWLLPRAKQLIVVRNIDQDPAEILWQTRKIGYDHLIGELEGGTRRGRTPVAHRFDPAGHCRRPRRCQRARHPAGRRVHGRAHPRRRACRARRPGRRPGDQRPARPDRGDVRPR